jgi:hypothetical protein
MKKTPSGTNPTLSFEDEPDPVLEPMGGEFQSHFKTVYPGGGDRLIYVRLLLTGNRCLKPRGCADGTVEIDRMGNWLGSDQAVANDGRQASGLQVFFV